MQKPVVSLSVSLAVAALCVAKRGGSLNLALLWGISSLATTQALLALRSKLFPSKEKSLLDVLNGGVCKGDLAKDVFRDAPAPTPPEYPKIPPHKVKPSTPSFDFGTDQGCAQGLAYLEEHGYVVARAVLSAGEVEEAKDLFWKWVEAVPERLLAARREFDPKYRLPSGGDKGVWPRRGKPSSWGSCNWVSDPHTGIVSGHGIGQSAFQWFVRSRQRVQSVFSAVWGTDDLLTSFDGCNAFRPWARGAAAGGARGEWKTRGGWFHVDQNAEGKRGKHCIQGLVTLLAATGETGGLVVIPGSHKQHDAIADRLQRKSAHDYVAMPPWEPVLQQEAVLVQGGAGDLLLWDSRTVHCNAPGRGQAAGENGGEGGEEGKEGGEEGGAGEEKEKEGAEEQGELLRLTSYVCMTPTRMAKALPELVEARVKAVEDCQTTTHWPHEFHGTSTAPPLKHANHPYLRLCPHLVTGRASVSQLGSTVLLGAQH